VAPVEDITQIAMPDYAREQQGDVVDHVRDLDPPEENLELVLRQDIDIAEERDHPLTGAPVDDCRGSGPRVVPDKVAEAGRPQMEAEIIERLRLLQFHVDLIILSGALERNVIWANDCYQLDPAWT
jgi:hypothetical protein